MQLLEQIREKDATIRTLQQAQENNQCEKELSSLTLELAQKNSTLDRIMARLQ